MKKILFAFFILLVISVGLSAQTIKIATGEWAPFHTEDRTDKGLMSKVITEAFALEKVKVEWTFLPWERAKQSTITGEYDASASWEPEGLPEFYYSDPTYTSSYVFFHLKTFKFSWKTMADLKGKTIGATIGYGYGDDFDNAEKAKTIKVSRVDDDETNFKLLEAGRIELFPNDKVVGFMQIEKTLGKEKAALFTTNEKPLRVYTFHLVMPKSKKTSEALMDKFNSGLKKLKASGRYAEIVKEVNR